MPIPPLVLAPSRLCVFAFNPFCMVVVNCGDRPRPPRSTVHSVKRNQQSATPFFQGRPKEGKTGSRRGAEGAEPEISFLCAVAAGLAIQEFFANPPDALPQWSLT